MVSLSVSWAFAKVKSDLSRGRGWPWPSLDCFHHHLLYITFSASLGSPAQQMRQHVARKVHGLPPAVLRATQVHVVQRVSQRHRARALRVTKELVRRGRPRAGRAHDQRGRGAGWCQLPRSLEGCGGVAGAWGEAEVGAASEQGARPLGGGDLEVGQRRPSRAQRRAVPVQSTKSATTTKSTFVYTSLTNAILAGPGEEFSAAAQAAIRTGVTAQLKQLASEVPSQFRCFVALAKRSPTGRWWPAEAERPSPFD